MHEELRGSLRDVEKREGYLRVKGDDLSRGGRVKIEELQFEGG